MSNFSFLAQIPEYRLFSAACIEAEKVLCTSAAMSAIGSRKALELAVKWVYAVDAEMQMPYQDNLQSLIHEPCFRDAVDSQTWSKFRFIIRLGNLAVHTERAVSRNDAVLSLRSLFEFIEWIDYCYGDDYAERHFDELAIPEKEVIIDETKIKEQESLISQKNSEIEALKAKLAELSAQFTAQRETHKAERSFKPEDFTEWQTRKRIIDLDLKLLGWFIGHNVSVEEPVTGMPNQSGEGFADYVLWGKDGLPLAVIEAKRAGKDPMIGKQQAKLYADCLEKKYHRRPMMFYTNGLETYFWDDCTYPPRKVSGIFSPDDLQKLMERRSQRKQLGQVEIDDKITDRYYQKEAIRAVCDSVMQGHRRSLLVMATGTGKTRTASSLTDVLSRGRYVTNILFLADRTALVKQAKDDFHNYLPDMSLCNLCTNKVDRNARIVFSTYPTMLNAIDSVKTEDGLPLFTPAHFDLIIIDEAHRSIFKKYRAIFDYFDALLVGLTATPKTDVDRNTYDFFEMRQNVPTYAYDYETAVEKDHVLVPYYNIETPSLFLNEGITYDKLSDADKERYEADFGDDETGELPAFISASQLNRTIFNQDTVDHVLQDLMTKGIKINGGDRIGKTIIFAQNKAHAQYIVDRFNALYPQYRGGFAARIVCDDSYAQSLIDEFKLPASPDPYSPDKEKIPHIAVSVDMMDTGIDVRHVVNLVFFKKVCSRTKFWQMIGRGTRLCPGLECVDSIDGTYTDKRRFLIFDYCGNFEFFRQKVNGIEGRETKTLSESIFCKRVKIMQNLEDARYNSPEYQEWRGTLGDTVYQQIKALNTELVSVRLQRQHICKFEERASLDRISEDAMHSLTAHIAPLIYTDEKDEYAKRFDNFMYGMILAQMESLHSLKKYRNDLTKVLVRLEASSTIPQIQAKMQFIQRAQTDDFQKNCTILDLEQLRTELRDLIQFIVEPSVKKLIYTDLEDSFGTPKEGETIGDGYDFEDYKLKVNRYIEEHKDETAIFKLRNNLPLLQDDYEALAAILMKDLGNPEDYQREFGDTPLGLLVRKIAKMERDAAMQAFSSFINEQNLNQQQIVFVHKIVDYVVENGYMESIKILMSPPFDKPQSFMRLFNDTERKELIQIINTIRDNAVQTA